MLFVIYLLALSAPDGVHVFNEYPFMDTHYSPLYDYITVRRFSMKETVINWPGLLLCNNFHDIGRCILDSIPIK